jgi:hypothetical protein
MKAPLRSTPNQGNKANQALVILSIPGNLEPDFTDYPDLEGKARTSTGDGAFCFTTLLHALIRATRLIRLWSSEYPP